MEWNQEVPVSFWSLFRSVNRDTYIEALLCINEEYEYNNYFLSRESCVQVLSDLYSQKRITLEQEEDETELDILETPVNRILNWLVRKKWLKKLDDYVTLTTNIVIPDYSAVFIEAFDKLVNEQMDDTEIYIQNVYATLYSFRNDPRAGISMLRTALVNTRKLNKALQDMLHNMDKFFGRLLDAKFYGDLLSEHLEGYVEEVVKKKYHILKTSDNFYIYKNDIKHCLQEMREDESWLLRVMRTEQIRQRSNDTMGQEDILDLLDLIERGFDDIEHRIANMDREHSKYIRATVTRLNYLLSDERDMQGLVVKLLAYVSDEEKGEEYLTKISEKMNCSTVEVLSEKSLYTRRRRKNFVSEMEPDERQDELSRGDVLKMNKLRNRYSRKQIEEFVEERMIEGVMRTEDVDISDDEAFEKLILAYDYSTRRNSKFKAVPGDVAEIDTGKYRYPGVVFIASGGEENTESEDEENVDFGTLTYKEGKTDD
ncbi:MAG: DUF5716 family protein [Hespellia sp.]|nr:DUF5716 family protein [Hespellia sp.]